MKTSEIVIVSMQDVGDAVFVNGTKIYARTSAVASDSSFTARDVGQRLATSLGTIAVEVEAPLPKASNWEWEEVFYLVQPKDDASQSSRIAKDSDTPEADDVEVGLYWDRRRYGQSALSHLDHAFHMRLQDQRAHAGRLTVATSASGDAAADTLYATMAIDRVPGYECDTQAIHITRDKDQETLILFKQGDGYLLLPPTGATVRPIVVEDDLPAYLIS